MAVFLDRMPAKQHARGHRRTFMGANLGRGPPNKFTKFLLPLLLPWHAGHEAHLVRISIKPENKELLLDYLLGRCCLLNWLGNATELCKETMTM